MPVPDVDDETLILEPPEGSTILLTPGTRARSLSGLSSKGLFIDAEGKEYYVKASKERKAAEIFKNDAMFNELLAQRRDLLGSGTEATTDAIASLSVEKRAPFEAIQAKLAPYEKHVEDLMLSNMAIEVIASRVSAAIMGDLLVAPSDYLLIHKGKPSILSPSVGDLKEFLAEHPSIDGVKTSEYWFSHSPPRFDVLVTTEAQAKVLGQAYFVALLFGHYDLVNNINLSNFGYLEQADGSLKLSIVDWGNALGVGFNGLTAEESAFKNPQFTTASSGVSYSPEDRAGYKHTMPFDEVVYPLLPRQVVSDLFDLTAEDCPKLRAAQRLGFYEACAQAMNMLPSLQELIPTVVHHALNEAMSLEDAHRVIPLLPKFITHERTSSKGIYNLANVLEGRMRSLQQIKLALQEGKKLQDIAGERLGTITKSQTLSPFRFFSHKPICAADALSHAMLGTPLLMI